MVVVRQEDGTARKRQTLKNVHKEKSEDQSSKK